MTDNPAKWVPYYDAEGTSRTGLKSDVDPDGGGDMSSAVRVAFPYTLQEITVPFEGEDYTYLWMKFAEDEPIIAWGLAGDAFPRVCLLSDISDGWFFSDGTYDAYNGVGPNISSFAHGFVIKSASDALVGAGNQTSIQLGITPGVIQFDGNLVAFSGNFHAGANQLLVDSIASTTTVVGIDIFDGQQAGVPADGVLAPSQFTLWLDDTPGATKLMIKAKDSAGTVRTGSIALT